MTRTFLRCLSLTLIPAACLLADFSYDQTATVTSGMMAGMMKFAGAFSKQAREPVRTTVAVKGDRMAHLSPTHISIIDLNKETITNIDPQKKTYSVMTFAEMQQVLEQASQKMSKDPNAPAMDFKVSANATGQTRQINGFDTKEIVVKMIMQGTDAKTGQTGGMTVTTDMWIAPKVTGYDEVANFYKRMATKMNWAPGGNPMLNRPDMAKAMAEVYKQMSSMDGMPVYQVVKMGMEGQMPPDASAAPPQQQQQPQQQQAPAEKPSTSSAIGSALGGRLGRFGGLGRKKKEEPPQQETPAPAQPAAAQQQPPANADASGALMEMTMEMSNFSTASVDASKFEVPAGFKQVKSDMEKGL